MHGTMSLKFILQVFTFIVSSAHMTFPNTGWGIKITHFRKGAVRAVVVVERWG